MENPTKSWGCSGDVSNKMVNVMGCEALKRYHMKKSSMNHPLKIIHLMGIFCVLQFCSNGL
jgi:hypothetical protein